MMVLWIVVFVIIVSFAYGGISAAPWVPTWGADVDRFMQLADIASGQKVYDLGCGDGRLVIAAARRGAHAVGYEVSLIPYALAQVRRFVSGQSNRAHIVLKDFWRADLSDADVVYVFLMEKIYDKLQAKLEQELKPGAKVVVYVWPLPGWEPCVVDETDGQPKLFVYEIGKQGSV